MTSFLVKSVRRSLHLVRSLVELSKMRMWMAIGLTIVPGMLLGETLPSGRLLFFTILGTILVAISSFVFNQIWEIEIDRSMERTKDRPLPSGRISSGLAWMLGLFCLFSGTILLYSHAGPLAAFWAISSLFVYIFLYTCLLKTRSVWNTVVGGFSGAVGPLIGEAAVSGTVSLHGLWMFLLLFVWQPPHFWVLALRLREDYKKAKILMLPVTRPVLLVWRHILLWQAALLAAIVAACTPLGLFSFGIYLTPSLGLGLLVFFFMLRLARKQEAEKTMPVFWMTIFHMLVWHIAIAWDLYLSKT